MPMLDEIVGDLTQQLAETMLEAIVAEIEKWQWTDADNDASEPKMTKEQMEYYNRGVMSVADLLESIKDGYL